MSDAPPRLAAPPGTTDTHLHIYGSRTRYPLAPTSPFDPPPGALDAYRAVMARLGIERAVVVQPAAYAADNRCTMDAVAALARALARAAPERMLWASNWPHPSEREHPPDDAQLLDVLSYWIEDEALRRRVLVDNPAELYGFPG